MEEIQIRLKNGTLLVINMMFLTVLMITKSNKVRSFSLDDFINIVGEVRDAAQSKASGANRKSS